MATVRFELLLTVCMLRHLLCFALESISIAKNDCGMPFFPEDFRFATRAPKYRVDLYFLPTKNVSTSRELRIVTWFFFYVVCFEGHLNRSTAI